MNPLDAITIEKREAAEFDEEATKAHLAKQKEAEQQSGFVCPGMMTKTLREKPNGKNGSKTAISSQLSHWPVQLTLVPPTAPFLQGADLVLAADCVPFAYAGFHQDFIKEHALLVACPKLDDFQAHLKKLTDILSQSSVKSLTVVHMEVPCCSGLVHMAKQALQLAGKDITLREVSIGIKGDVKNPVRSGE